MIEEVDGSVLTFLAAGAKATQNYSPMDAKRVAVRAVFLILVMLLVSEAASAQALLAGNWNPYRNHEDEQDRGPGPDLGD